MVMSILFELQTELPVTKRRKRVNMSWFMLPMNISRYCTLLFSSGAMGNASRRPITLDGVTCIEMTNSIKLINDFCSQNLRCEGGIPELIMISDANGLHWNSHHEILEISCLRLGGVGISLQPNLLNTEISFETIAGLNMAFFNRSASLRIEVS